MDSQISASLRQAPPLRCVRAKTLVRRMRGGCQADLVLTDRGPYVVKWQQNAQHRRVLINEALAAQLMVRLGIAAADWAIVKADAAFLAAFPETRISLHDRYRNVEPGRHFGSRVPRNPNTTVIFDFLPTPLLTRLRNVDDLFAAFVFDAWSDNGDHRQAVFARADHTWFEARLIDNGHAFGFDGAEWKLCDRVGHALQPLPRSFYFTEHAKRCFATTIDSIRSISAIDLRGVIDRLPEEWIGTDMPALERLRDTLIHRAGRLRELLKLRLDYLASAREKLC